MIMANHIATDMMQTRDQVLAICDLQPDALNELQFETALQCLEKVLQSDAHGIAELPKNAAFWAWWREQWYRRDVQFLTSLQWNVDLMKYTCLLPGGNTRVVLLGTSSMQSMYLRYHRVSIDNPLVNNRSIEVSFHCMLKDLSIKH
jgi:hypothetical protein